MPRNSDSRPVGSGQKIRLGIGINPLCAALFILAGKLHIIPSAGNMTGLPMPKLVVSAKALFVSGALNNIGIGSYAPTRAIVYALGVDPKVAFPIMMGGCAFSALSERWNLSGSAVMPANQLCGYR